MAKYTNTRNGAERESSSPLGYPYVLASKIASANKGAAKTSTSTDAAPKTADKGGAAGDAGKA